MRILNVTQHAATSDQIAEGVFDLPEAERKELGELLTFRKCPIPAELVIRADQVAELVSRHNGEFDAIMIGGAPWFMAYIENVFRQRKVKMLYAWSERVAQEVTEGGVTKKTMVFKHAGWIEG